MYMRIARDLNRADVRGALEVWAEELTRKFQVPSQVHFYSEIAPLQNDFESGRIIMVIADAMTFVRYFKPTDLAEGFTTKLPSDASLLLLSKSDSKTINLQGKRVAQIGNDDLSSLYLETLCLRHYGKSCEDNQVTFVPVSNNHQAVTKLLFGQAELALVNRHGFEIAKELNPQLANVGRVVSELPFDTQYFGFFSAKVDRIVRARALQSIPSTNTDLRGRQMLEVFKVDQVALADPVALQPFYRLEKEYRDLKAKARSKGAK
jgi:hypothetical protein